VTEMFSTQPIRLAPEVLRLEAILAVADRPLSPSELAGAARTSESEIPALLEELSRALQGHALCLKTEQNQIAMVTHRDLGDVVASFLESDLSRPLSKAAIETLAIVAYMQPISRGQVSEVRGVNSEGVIRTLCQRGYLVSERTKDGTAHEPALLATTSLFLERFGLESLESLEPLAQFVPDVDAIEALEGARRNQ